MPKRASSFVSTFEPVELPAPKRPQPTVLGLGDIFAQWVQNLGGGIGVGAAVAVAFWLFGRDAGATFKWATACGVLAWAVLMAVRSVIDELVDYGAWREMQEELDAVAEERDEALDELDQERRAHAETLTDLTFARQEAQNLRRQLAPNFTPPTDTTGDTVADADRLLRMYFELGRWPARDYVCETFGWDRERWAEAYRLLRDASVVELNHKSTRVLFDDYGSAVAALSRFSQEVDLIV